MLSKLVYLVLGAFAGFVLAGAVTHAQQDRVGPGIPAKWRCAAGYSFKSLQGGKSFGCTATLQGACEPGFPVTNAFAERLGAYLVRFSYVCGAYRYTR